MARTFPLFALLALVTATATPARAYDRYEPEMDIDDYRPPPRVETETEPPEEEKSSLSLWGPRIGVTGIIGEEGRLLRERLGLGVPVMTQFGWQFELRFFEQPSGWIGVNELLFMVGGLEQGTFLPTATWIVGIRTPFGFEVGAGPTINFVQMISAIDRGTFGFGRIGDSDQHRSLEGLGVAIAAGMTVPVGDISFPINLAVVPNKDGVRITLLLGFTLPSSDDDQQPDAPANRG